MKLQDVISVVLGIRDPQMTPGVSTEDLLEIYVLFKRSIAEYCSVAYHSSLNVENCDKLEQIQKTCLKVIPGEMYVGYTAALEMFGL